MIPVVGPTPPAGKQISTGKVDPIKKWTFSWRFFRQIEYFGAREKDAGWFVSLFDRLSVLSSKTISEVLANPREKQLWRMHEINWNLPGIPIKLQDLHWIERKYLDNQTEYPLWQFSLSTALGRVIGFRDELNVFNIVLIDPSHNMQPSSFSDFKPRPAHIADGEFQRAIAHIEASISGCGDGCGCRNLYSAIQKGLTQRLNFPAMLVSMPERLFSLVAVAIQDGTANCVSDLLEIAVDHLGLQHTTAPLD